MNEKENRKEIKERIKEMLEIDDDEWDDIPPKTVRPAKEYLRKVIQILNGRKKTPKGMNRDDTLIFWDSPQAMDTFLDTVIREGWVSSHWYEEVE